MARYAEVWPASAATAIEIEWFPPRQITAEQLSVALDLGRRRMNVICGYRNARYFHRRGFKRGDL